MLAISVLKSMLNNIENNLYGLDRETNELEDKINDIIKTIKENDEIFYNEIITLINSQGVLENSDIFDYTVTMDDLVVKEEGITIKYKLSSGVKEITFNIYTAKNPENHALYIVINDVPPAARREIIKELKNHLTTDQMAILTFDGQPYHYDINSADPVKECSTDYAVVGKDSKGKMYAFQAISMLNPDDKNKNSEIVVDNGSSNSTLMTSINGMILANNMRLTMEEECEVHLKAIVKKNTDGGQEVKAFKRLSFSCGVKDSSGSEYAEVYMDGDYYQYGYNSDNDDMKIYDELGKKDKKSGKYDVEDKYLQRVVYIGNENDFETYEKDGVTRYKLKDDEIPEYMVNAGTSAHKVSVNTIVGHVANSNIPFTVKAKDTKGSKKNMTMQATVCYFYDGKRVAQNNSHGSKDMFLYSIDVVDDWEKDCSHFYNWSGQKWDY